MRRLPVGSGGIIGFRFRRVVVALVVLGTFTVSCGDSDIAAFGPPTSVRATSTRTDADLVILVDETSKTVVDALLLAGGSAGRDVWIGLSCFGSKPAVLVDRNAKPARAWKVSTDPLRLTEVDTSELTGEEIDSACANLPVHLR